MTRAEKDKRYKKKMDEWKKENYLTFCFHLPKELVEEFREKTKEKGDTQRQLVIEMMKKYVEKENKSGKEN
jgi:metal-responsive CopG/Arc/MetJ family transcriptional regulator